MVLPTGVDKASGLLAALEEVQVSPNRCIGIGDAENDCTFLSICGMSVSVANALAVLQKQSDLVTKGSRGDGVSELIELLIQSEDIEADLA
jgi:hydroxymethylpyrimidine pyrophosphatase-like HAD family hydrolase